METTEEELPTWMYHKALELVDMWFEPNMRSNPSQCNDGSYSANFGRGACTWHDGVKKEVTTNEYQKSKLRVRGSSPKGYKGDYAPATRKPKTTTATPKPKTKPKATSKPKTTTKTSNYTFSIRESKKNELIEMIKKDVKRLKAETPKNAILSELRNQIVKDSKELVQKLKKEYTSDQAQMVIEELNQRVWRLQNSINGWINNKNMVFHIDRNSLNEKYAEVGAVNNDVLKQATINALRLFDFITPAQKSTLETDYTWSDVKTLVSQDAITQLESEFDSQQELERTVNGFFDMITREAREIESNMQVSIPLTTDNYFGFCKPNSSIAKTLDMLVAPPPRMIQGVPHDLQFDTSQGFAVKWKTLVEHALNDGWDLSYEKDPASRAKRPPYIYLLTKTMQNGSKSQFRFQKQDEMAGMYARDLYQQFAPQRFTDGRMKK